MILKSSILSLIITLFLCQPAYSQNSHNRTEHVYGNDTVISDEPLPDKVYQAHKNNLMIVINFYAQEENKKEKIGLFASLGNGSFVKPGIIITARHILTEALKQFELTKSEHSKSGIIASYSYEIFGVIISEDPQVVTLPLNLRAYENTGSERDLMALEVPPEIMRKAFEISVINPNDPSRILLATAKFADAKLANLKSNTNDVYIVGTIYSDYDMLHYIFQAQVGAVLENMAANRRGLKKHYRLIGHAEPGYSGGPVLNKDGELIGITILSTDGRNFIYAVSSKDVKDFLKDN